MPRPHRRCAVDDDDAAAVSGRYARAQQRDVRVRMRMQVGRNTGSEGGQMSTGRARVTGQARRTTGWWRGSSQRKRTIIPRKIVHSLVQTTVDSRQMNRKWTCKTYSVFEMRSDLRAADEVTSVGTETVSIVGGRALGAGGGSYGTAGAMWEMVGGSKRHLNLRHVTLGGLLNPRPLRQKNRIKAGIN
ncbi:hypothetical protein DFH09DRAFT_1287814 [Mycena vulgaris]|nr:hypothetical protein DFH09DRAFT_1287814 [Mycena vulgaris]